MFDKLKQKVNSLVSQLHDQTDRSWLVATYMSLRTAHELGYQRDEFANVPKSERESVLQRVISDSLLNPAESPPIRELWLAGYFFNNAVLRMVALAEIGLKNLYKKDTGTAPLDDYKKLAKWYKLTYGNELKYLKRARLQVNEFKHELRDMQKKRKFETMEEGVSAFKELLVL